MHAVDKYIDILESFSIKLSHRRCYCNGKNRFKDLDNMLILTW